MEAKNHPIQACLFDLDGVLVDTAKYHFLAWKRLADELGFEFTENDNERLKGVSRMASLDILLSVGNVQLDEETKIALAEKKNNWYVDYISKMDASEILPGSLAFLQELKERGIKIALGSASKNAMTILNNANLVPYFDAIIDGTKTSNAKPDPEVFVLGAQEVQVDPEHCVVFEDAEAGIEAAIRAGMRSIGIGSADTLTQAEYVVSSLAEMSVEKLQQIMSNK
ncbi:beta-phosphoglucomutase [Paenibacillus crassostreae]|uniref:Beta-phosphoglucomutase n=1 Tax=Paenibacillus crassostreae TaxID=1763538 RepID=A0A162RJP8_9BACL|nr:beta-phosphoglucomutase [Paenibacillus crassostreae]AOZ92498.1 beta-phosphoglucomutase [Paenibacillus crassostreae]OAB72447.1 beta-phosphoglucomutase [Paenibacillus crassostreae]